MALRQPPRCPDDAYVNERLHALLRGRIDDPQHVTSALSLYIRRIHLGKLLGLYEAYRMVTELPGSVVELGVFKGESLLFFGKLMELLNVNDRSARVIGFDNFTGFPGLHAKDGADDTRVDKQRGGWSSADYRDELLSLINAFDHDRLAGHKPRIELVEGDITETVPAFVAAHPGLRIKLLNLDCDLYEPTLVGLERLYPLVVEGGVVLLDEYGFEQFPGESRAVEEYFGDAMPVIRKFPFYSNPGGYFVKRGAAPAR
jgi:hypothetical protein